jgi:predicted YcjX-like family ATPase
VAAALARGWTDYLAAARGGFSDCTPGRFLLPGDLEGSPAITFAPLPPGEAPRGSLAREFARRYEAYKREVVKPFFRAHFARIDRQIVLVDALGAIHAGPPALEDLRQAMAAILGAFRPGRNAFLSSLLGRRVDRILFAATKADHLHHDQHPRLEAVIEALVTEARRRAEFSGAETRAMAIASLRATTEEVRRVNGADLGLVRGTLLEDGRQAALHPGDLPADPAALLAPARDGAETWLSGDYGVMRFAPAALSLRNGEGPPHIRLDRAAEFLIGDRYDRPSWTRPDRDRRGDCESGAPFRPPPPRRSMTTRPCPKAAPCRSSPRWAGRSAAAGSRAGSGAGWWRFWASSCRSRHGISPPAFWPPTRCWAGSRRR